MKLAQLVEAHVIACARGGLVIADVSGMRPVDLAAFAFFRAAWIQQSRMCTRCRSRKGRPS